MTIKGSIALVTGVNRGLGLACAKALLAAGASKVYADARDPASCVNVNLVRSSGGRARRSCSSGRAARPRFVNGVCSKVQ